MAVHYHCGKFANDAEQHGCDLLSEQFSEDWALFSNIKPEALNLKGRHGYEVDALLVSTQGAACIDIKGWSKTAECYLNDEWVGDGKRYENFNDKGSKVKYRIVNKLDEISGINSKDHIWIEPFVFFPFPDVNVHCDRQLEDCLLRHNDFKHKIERILKSRFRPCANIEVMKAFFDVAAVKSDPNMIQRWADQIQAASQKNIYKRPDDYHNKEYRSENDGRSEVKRDDEPQPFRVPIILAGVVITCLIGAVLLNRNGRETGTGAGAGTASRTVGPLNVNLRNAPDPASTILATLTPGTILTDLGSSTAPDGAVWIKVRSSTGEVGFINQRLLLSNADATPAIAQPPPQNAVTAAPEAPPLQPQVEQPAGPVEASPSPVPLPSVERARLAQEVQQVIFASDVSHGQPVVNTTYAIHEGAGAGIYIKYVNASPSDQYAVVVKYGNQINASLCSPRVVGFVNGSYACQLGNLSVGHYQMFFQINGQDINVTDFDVFPSLPAQVAGQQALPYSIPQRVYPRYPYAEQQRNYPIHHARPGTACYAAFGGRIAPHGQPYCN